MRRFCADLLEGAAAMQTMVSDPPSAWGGGRNQQQHEYTIAITDVLPETGDGSLSGFAAATSVVAIPGGIATTGSTEGLSHLESGATVDEKRHTGDEAGFVGGEENGRRWLRSQAVPILPRKGTVASRSARLGPGSCPKGGRRRLDRHGCVHFPGQE